MSLLLLLCLFVPWISMSERLGLQPIKFLASRQRGQATATGIQMKSGFGIPRRIRPDGRLTGHQGCVNTVSWSREGDLLLSGSDDCQLNIYQWNRRILNQSIPSGHASNIFSAHFLPRSGNREIVSCAGNGTIHLTYVDRPDLYGYHPFLCHKSTCYEVAVSPWDPQEFYSCGEDGCVRLYDLRRKRKCLCRHTDCKEDILVSLPDAASSLSVHPLHPCHFAVACADAGVREFDRRMLSPDRQQEVALYRPRHLEDTKRKITCVRYSPDGLQLLASYSAEYLYLFNRDSCQGDSCALAARPQLSGGSRHCCLPLTTPPNLRDPSHLVSQEVAQGEKRIKFRSDWSDTGPGSRPDAAGTGSTADRLSTILNSFSRPESDDRNSDGFEIHYFDVPGEEDGVIDSTTEVRESDCLPGINIGLVPGDTTPPRPLPPSPPPAVPSASPPASWYQGHRNVRTMIKQANFWGDSHVVSGSDCGRVFFWNKWTAEIELYLEADRHVVNCVQPHPLEPTLATSGIDYDIKLFTPRGVSGTVSRDTLLPDLEEVVRVNEEMLEQSYSTFNVPILSLLRLMAAHRVRGDPGEGQD